MPNIETTIRKINSFAKLENGWHYGSGVPSSDSFIDHATVFLTNASIEGIERFNAFPGINGEVQITLHYKNNNISFTWELDATITVVEDVGGKIISDNDGLTAQEALDKLWEFIQKTQTLSESYIYVTGMKKPIDLKVPHSVYPPIKEYPWLGASVQSTTQAQLARILHLSTQTSQVIPQSFGVLKKRIFQNASSSNQTANPVIDVITTCSV